MPVRHADTYARPGNLDFPAPENWNADHNAPPCICTLNSGNVTWTNMPAALTELFGNVHRRSLVDLTHAAQARLVVRVSTVGSANAVLAAQYSLDESSWSVLSGVLAIGGGSAGVRATAWDTIPAPALTDVFVRIAGQSGDGAADPILGTIQLQYR